MPHSHDARAPSAPSPVRMLFAIVAAICCLGLAVCVAYYYPQGNISISNDARKTAKAKPAAKEPESQNSSKHSNAERTDCLKLLKEARALEFGLDGTTMDCAKAFALYAQAAKAGHADAQYAVAKLYRKGEVVARDRQEGDKWLRLAAEGGSSQAKAELGLMLLKAGPPESSSEAAMLLMEAAEAGDSMAAFSLARLFFGGKPSETALSTIRYYAEKSFDGGKAEGAFLMALSYTVGRRPNQDMALRWLEMGKADHDWRSHYALHLIQNGAGTVDAFKAAVKAKYADWLRAPGGGNGMPENIATPGL